MERVYYIGISNVSKETFIKEFLYNLYQQSLSFKQLKSIAFEHLKDVLEEKSHNMEYVMNGIVFKTYIIGDQNVLVDGGTLDD